MEAIIKLIAQRDGVLPPFPGDQTRAAILSGIRKIDEELASTLHNFPRLKPYAVKPVIPLRGKKRIRRDRWIIEEGDVLKASISVLDDGLSDRFRRAIVRIESLEIAGVPFVVAPDTVFREIPYERFPNKEIDRFTIRFLTPVAFKGLDEKWVTPFPEPSRLFKSLSNIWAKFSGAMPVPPDQVVPIKYELTTREVRVVGVKVVGCKGEVTYEILGESNDAYKLLTLAEFSNVGYKRTAGLGVVEVKFGGRVRRRRLSWEGKA